MSENQIVPGLEGCSRATVRTSDLASAYGNPGVDVMSSMTLMTLLEQAAIDAIGPLMPGDRMSVGARMEMDHLAPTPEGMEVIATAKLSEVKGPKMVFTLSAHDGVEQVARAVHTRYLVDKQKFLKNVDAKRAKEGK